MAGFSFFRHDRYPGLNIQVDIDPTEIGATTVARVALFVEGNVAARSSMIQDVQLWAARHDLTPTSMRSVHSCCRYEYELKGWNVVADFMVTWIGVDNLSETMNDREFLERRIFGEVRALTHKVEALSSQICRLTASMPR